MKVKNNAMVHYYCVALLHKVVVSAAHTAFFEVDDCLVKTNGSDKNIRNILFRQWIMLG